MLKYVGDILSKFTQSQRIIALLILLISIILMTNGDQLIKSFKGNTEDVKIRLENQQRQIIILQEETSRLNQQIIDNQISCTNKIIEREKELAIKIQKIIDLGKIQHKNQMIILDTINPEVLASPKIIDNNVDVMVNELTNLKKSLGKK
jgi:hypothetical protein